MAYDECFHEGHLRVTTLFKLMANMPQQPSRLKRRRNPANGSHVDQQTGSNGLSASLLIADQGLSQNDEIQKAKAQHSPPSENIAAPIHRANGLNTQQVAASCTRKRGPSVNELALVRSTAAADGFPDRSKEEIDVVDSNEEEPQTVHTHRHVREPSYIPHLDRALVREKEHAKPDFTAECRKKFTRRRHAAASPPKFSHGCGDGFTGIESHSPPKVSSKPITRSEKRTFMPRKKRILHTFKALALASGPLPVPSEFAEQKRPLSPISPPKTHEDGLIAAVELSRPRSTPQGTPLTTPPRTYTMDAPTQTSPARSHDIIRAQLSSVAAPDTITAQLASVSAPARIPTESTSCQELDPGEILFENDSTAAEQSETQSDTRVHGHTRLITDNEIFEIHNDHGGLDFWSQYGSID